MSTHTNLDCRPRSVTPPDAAGAAVLPSEQDARLESAAFYFGSALLSLEAASATHSATLQAHNYGYFRRSMDWCELYGGEPMRRAMRAFVAAHAVRRRM